MSDAGTRSIVMPWLGHGIHVFADADARKTWMPTCVGMTIGGDRWVDRSAVWYQTGFQRSVATRRVHA